jgi:hypothetical protein
MNQSTNWLRTIRGFWVQQSITTKLIAIQAIAVPLVTFLTLLIHGTNHLYDPSLYHQYALDLMAGKFPYRDFPVEYPPLVLLPALLPALLGLGRPLHLYVYAILFVIEMIGCSTLVAIALLRVALLQKTRPETVLTFYAVFAILMAPLLPWRYDLFPALLTLLSLQSIVTGYPSLAGLWLGLGITAKLYPLVLIPIFGAYYIAHRDIKGLARFLSSCIATTGLVTLPFLIVCPQQFLLFLQYHQLRGLQIESFPSGLLLLAQQFGWISVSIEKNYGAEHLATSLSAIILRGLPFIFVALLGVAIFRGLQRFRYEYLKQEAINLQTLATYTVLAISIFMVANKVFSPQYIIWLLPLVPLLRLRQAVLFGVICLTTILVDPFLYKELVTLQIVPILLLNLRNLLMITLISLLVKDTSIAIL